MRPKEELLSVKLLVINLGLEIFAETLENHGVPVSQVDWSPPAGGDPRLVELLRRLDEGRGDPNRG